MDKKNITQEPVGALYLGMLGTVRLFEHNEALLGPLLIPTEGKAILYGKSSEGLFVVIYDGPGETYKAVGGKLFIPLSVYQGWCEVMLKQQREVKKAEYGSKY